MKAIETGDYIAALAERLPQLVWTTQADGFHDYFNTQWYHFTGLTPAESRGQGWRSAVHPEDLEKVDAAWCAALASFQEFEAEYRIRSAAGPYRWVLSRGLPDRDAAGKPIRWYGTCTVIDAQKQAETSLRALDEQYRLALDAAKLGTWKIDLDSRTVSWDEGSCVLFQMPAEGLRSMPLEAAMMRVHPEDRERVRSAIETATAPGSPGTYEIESRTVLDDGTIRWTRSNGRVYYSEDGLTPRVAGLSGVVRDVTDERSAAESQELVTRELTHRVKNLFAIANGMVSMTARTAKNTADMATALRGRLSALSRAHELAQPLSTGAAASGAGVHLDQLLGAALAPYEQEEEGRIHAEGPVVTVGPGTTTSLALVLHELATNAAKYGCLSSHAGHLDIQWTTSEDAVVLTWCETGGPRIEQAPTFEGFGTQLAQRSIGGQLGGSIDRDWDPAGLRVRMRLPFDRLSS